MPLNPPNLYISTSVSIAPEGTNQYELLILTKKKKKQTNKITFLLSLTYVKRIDKITIFLNYCTAKLL